MWLSRQETQSKVVTSKQAPHASSQNSLAALTTLPTGALKPLCSSGASDFPQDTAGRAPLSEAARKQPPVSSHDISAARLSASPESQSRIPSFFPGSSADAQTNVSPPYPVQGGKTPPPPHTHTPPHDQPSASPGSSQAAAAPPPPPPYRAGRPPPAAPGRQPWRGAGNEAKRHRGESGEGTRAAAGGGGQRRQRTPLGRVATAPAGHRASDVTRREGSRESKAGGRGGLSVGNGGGRGGV